MNRHLLLRDNLVVNVIAWDGVTPWEAPDDVTVMEAPAGVGPGHRLVDGEWVAPSQPELDDEFLVP